MKNEHTPDRWALAMKLDAIRGADLYMDEIDAIEQAIQIVCPEYAQARDDAEQETADWYDSTTPEERAKFVEEQMKKYPPPSPDRSGTPAVPPVFDGKILRFGEEKKK